MQPAGDIRNKDVIFWARTRMNAAQSWEMTKGTTMKVAKAMAMELAQPKP